MVQSAPPRIACEESRTPNPVLPAARQAPCHLATQAKTLMFPGKNVACCLRSGRRPRGESNPGLMLDKQVYLTTIRHDLNAGW